MAWAKTNAKTPGGTTKGGWGNAHQKLRAVLAKRHQPTDPCVRCGHPLGQMGPWLHLDHNHDRTGYLGFSHGGRCPVCGARCNLRAAAKKARAIQLYAKRPSPTATDAHRLVSRGFWSRADEPTCPRLRARQQGPRVATTVFWRLGNPSDLPLSHIHSQHFFPNVLVLQDAVETGPPPQLVPAAHRHNLPAQRLTRKAIDAGPTRFPLDFEGFAANLAITLRHHTLKRPIVAPGWSPRAEKLWGAGQKLRAYSKSGPGGSPCSKSA
jgi:hypothetical protein